MRKILVAATLRLLLCTALAIPPVAQAQEAAKPTPKAPAPSDPSTAKPAKRSRKKAKAPAAGATGVAAGGSAAAPAEATAKKSARRKHGKSGKSGKSGKKGAPPPAASDALAPPSASAAVTAPAPAAPAAQAPAPAVPAQVPAEEAATGPADDEPPVIVHTAVANAIRGKPLALSAHVTDAGGVFHTLLWLRRHGGADYLPLRMTASRSREGDFVAEVADKLVTVDLDYYIEAFDNAGNRATAGTPDQPNVIRVEDEKKPAVVITGGLRRGSPPSITHTAVARATRGRAVEINAKLVGETGVSSPTLMFRHLGEKAFKALPMGDLGDGSFTATVPAATVTGDLEYFLEAFDKDGNGPGRSGGPTAPYKVTVIDPAPVAVSGAVEQPRVVKAPFKANPGRATGWLFMAGFVGSEIFAGANAYGAWSADQTYKHTLAYEGRLVPELHDRSTQYADRAKKFAIAGGAALAVSIVLLLVFPGHADAAVAGSGGDAPGIRF